jgi:hypothetical protein
MTRWTIVFACAAAHGIASLLHPPMQLATLRHTVAALRSMVAIAARPRQRLTVDEQSRENAHRSCLAVFSR